MNPNPAQPNQTETYCGNETKPVSDLMNSMKVLDRSKRYIECRADVLTALMYELAAFRAAKLPAAVPEAPPAQLCRVCNMPSGFHWDGWNPDQGCWAHTAPIESPPAPVEYRTLYEAKARQIAGLIVSGHAPSLDKLSRLLAMEDAGTPAAPPADKPTWAYELSMYLTRNNQQHTFDQPSLQKGIEQFLRDKEK